MKRKWVNMILGLDHTPDLDLGVSRSESAIVLSQEWDSQLTKKEKIWVIHSWPSYWLVRSWWGGRMYHIVTGVTSDIGAPSTYLVFNIFFLSWSIINRRQTMLLKEAPNGELSLLMFPTLVLCKHFSCCSYWRVAQGWHGGLPFGQDILSFCHWPPRKFVSK